MARSPSASRRKNGDAVPCKARNERRMNYVEQLGECGMMLLRNCRPPRKRRAPPRTQYAAFTDAALSHRRSERLLNIQNFAAKRQTIAQPDLAGYNHPPSWNLDSPRRQSEAWIARNRHGEPDLNMLDMWRVYRFVERLQQPSLTNRTR
ncbi:hypothetical protein F01_320125 [Burkholderia cenocepacia]|nr:hypothetical protein F01_320125 [Burkholderia cenocepacia]